MASREEMIRALTEQDQIHSSINEVDSEALSREQMIAALKEQDSAPELTKEKPKASKADKARAGLEGFAESASMGTLPYLKAAGEVATDWLAEKIHDVPAKEKDFSTRVDKFRDQGKELQEKAPGYAIGGQLAGFIAPGMGVAKGVQKGLQAASGASRVGQIASAVEKSGEARKLYQLAAQAKQAGNAQRASTLIKAARADLAKQGLKLSAEGAIIGAAYTPESGFSDIEARAENAAMGAGTGAILPAALRGTGQALKATAKAPAWVGKKTLSTLGRVSEDVIDRYLENPQRIRAAKTFDELYDNVTTIVNNLSDDFDNAKLDYEAATKHLDEVSKGIKESRVEGKATALEEVKKAQKILDDSFKGAKQELAEKGSASRLEPLVEESVSGLKQKVIKGSQEATEALGDETISASPVYQNLLSTIEDLSQRGSDAAKTAVNKLRDYASFLHSKGATNESGEFIISAKEAKKIIQDIDADVSSWNKAGGSFDDPFNRGLKALRSNLDEVIKGSNESYRAQMVGVADDAKLLSQASDRFGKPDRAVSRLSNLARPTAKYDVETLKNLGKKAGGDLPQVVDEVVEAQRTLKSPIRLEGVKSKLPENKAVREAEMNLAYTKRLAKPKAVQESIQKSNAYIKALSAKDKMRESKKIYDRFKDFNEKGAEAKLKQVGRGKIYLEKKLTELSKLSDQDFVEAVKASADAAEFTKTALNGSRNVNIWGVLGAGGGGFFAGGPVGAMVGVVAGGMMDVYGPRVTKKILDGIIKVKGPITESAISKFDIPESAKRTLQESFKRAVLSDKAASSAKVANQDQTKGPEKWANDGAKKLQSTGLDPEIVEVLKASPKGKKLLIAASELKPGTKAMNNIISRINKEYGE